MFIFVCLTSNSSSNPSLDFSIKQTKLNHNKVIVNKIVYMRHYITIYNIIIFFICKLVLKKYLYRIEIGLYTFVNKFI